MKTVSTAIFKVLSIYKLSTFLLPLFLVTQALHAQVGIGTFSPHSSAQLEVASDDKGILIPRMNQQARNAISPLTEGLLIYQTDNIPGFYYYNGSSWMPVKDPKPPVTGFSAYISETTVSMSAFPIRNWTTVYNDNSFAVLNGVFTVVQAGVYRISALVNFSHITSSSASISSTVRPRMIVYRNLDPLISSDFPILDINTIVLSYRTLLNTGTVPIEGVVSLDTGDKISLCYDATTYFPSMIFNIQWSVVKID